MHGCRLLSVRLHDKRHVEVTDFREELLAYVNGWSLDPSFLNVHMAAGY